MLAASKDYLPMGSHPHRHLYIFIYENTYNWKFCHLSACQHHQTPAAGPVVWAADLLSCCSFKSQVLNSDALLLTVSLGSLCEELSGGHAIWWMTASCVSLCTVIILLVDRFICSPQKTQASRSQQILPNEHVHIVPCSMWCKCVLYCILCVANDAYCSIGLCYNWPEESAASDR